MTAETIAVEFKNWLSLRGWGHLGRDSLAKKLKVGASVIQAAIDGRPMQRRSKYQLWKATGLACFKVEATPLEEWMYQHNEYPVTLAKLIEKKTGREIGINTLESISQSSSVPSRENADALFKVTGLPLYAPVDDPMEATRRLLEQQEPESSAEREPSRPVYSGGQFAPTNHVLDERLTNLSGEVASLHSKLDIVARIMNITWDEQLSHIEQFAVAFEHVVASLYYFKTCSPAERKALVDRIGADHLSHWVGMLSALTDEKQFAFWKQMSLEPSR